MQYLVELRLSSTTRPMTQEEGVAFIEQFIFPTLERCKKLQADKKIVGGGPVSGAVALAIIVDAESAKELDDLLTTLPVWPRMETDVTPLTTFDARIQSLMPLRAGLKAQVREIRTTPGGGR